jgi:hypothetical protein
MYENVSIDPDALSEEIVRYLAAVELFRSLGSKPVWRPEPDCASRQAPAPVPTDVARVVH